MPKKISGPFRLACLLFALTALGCFPKQAGPRLAHFAQQAPQVGEQAPDFRLRDLDGQEVRLSELIGDKPIVLQFGSHSCPVYRYRRHSMSSLWEDFADSVEFLVIYTREAHPVGSRSPYAEGEWDPWINRVTRARVAEPADHDARCELAAWSKARLEIPVRFLVDSMDDVVWRRWGGASAPAFIIDSRGRVAAAQVWTEPKGLRRVLETLLK